MSVARTGEFGLIARVTARLEAGPSTLSARVTTRAVVAASDGRVVASTDALVEGRHFRRDWSTGVDVGHRAAAANLADIAAMGAVPTALARRPVRARRRSTCAGRRIWPTGSAPRRPRPAPASSAATCPSSPTLTLSVTALGDLHGVAPVLRSGARPGDVVAMAGRLGYAAAGYTVLSRGFRTPKLLVEAYRRPEIPYAAGPEAARRGATSMIDISDGLIADLGHVATASRVAIDLDKAAFDVPPQMRDAAQALGIDPYHWVLGGGEDHALVATFPEGTTLPDGFTPIGRVVDGSGVTVDGKPHKGPAGWDHFR